MIVEQSIIWKFFSKQEGIQGRDNVLNDCDALYVRVMRHCQL